MAKFHALVTSHCYIKTTVTIFFLPRSILLEKQRFSAMANYFFFIRDFSMVFCKANWCSKDGFGDWWIKLRNIKLYKCIVFFHWLNCSLLLKFLLILSTLAMWILEGLISRQGKNAWKFGSWSFDDMNAGVLAWHSILLSSYNFLEMCLASTLIAFSRYSINFW